MFNSVSQSIRPIIRILSVLLITAFLSACGYKGPLYLPPPPNTLEGQDNSTKQAPVTTNESAQEKPSTGERKLLEPAPILIE